MTKSTAIIFVLFFGLMFKLEKPVSILSLLNLIYERAAIIAETITNTDRSLYCWRALYVQIRVNQF